MIDAAVNGKRGADLARQAVATSNTSCVSTGVAATGLTGLTSGLSGNTACGLLAGAASIATPLAPLAVAVAVVAGRLLDYLLARTQI